MIEQRQTVMRQSCWASNGQITQLARQTRESDKVTKESETCSVGYGGEDWRHLAACLRTDKGNLGARRRREGWAGTKRPTSQRTRGRITKAKTWSGAHPQPHPHGHMGHTRHTHRYNAQGTFLHVTYRLRRPCAQKLCTHNSSFPFFCLPSSHLHHPSASILAPPAISALHLFMFAQVIPCCVIAVI